MHGAPVSGPVALPGPDDIVTITGRRHDLEWRCGVDLDWILENQGDVAKVSVTPVVNRPIKG